MSTVTLISSDDQKFTVDLAVIKQSNLIKQMLSDLGPGGDDQEPTPVPNVKGSILQKVLEWCEHHKDDAPQFEGPVVEANPSRPSLYMPKWDQEFFNVDQPILFELILAANYLDIKGMLDYGCKTVTGMMVGKTPEEVRELFSIENDFTPEEEAKIREQNSWCEKPLEENKV